MANFPRLVQNYIEKRFREFDEVRKSKLASISTKAEMEAYVEECRNTIRSLYPLPEERCPLNTIITGTIEKSGYRIEKLMFDSHPDFRVTANLYIPLGEGPFPCVLGTCGHSNEGKAANLYQSFAAGLALRGFMVLLYDPIGQGERWQYLEHKETIPGCVAEHILAGKQQHLLGDYFGAWRAWDGIRALDVLLDRPEADAQNVGITGNSGGGTMTSIITALEDRITMSAPGCYITTFRHNLENELPADTEQVCPGIIAAGYEEYDHFTAMAPRPLILLTKEDDFFDQRGSQEAFAALQRTYDLLGKADDIQIKTGVGGHGYSQDLREAMYAFFCKHAGIEADSAEQEIALCTQEELYVTKTGQVCNEGSKRIYRITRERLLEAEESRPGFDAEKFKQLLHLKALPEEAPDFRVLRRQNGMSRIAVETEQGILNVMSFPRIEGSDFRLPPVKSAVIYLSHFDQVTDPEAETGLQELINDTRPVFIYSIRGQGESRYITCDENQDNKVLYGSDFLYDSYANMMGFNLAGTRVFDVLRLVQLLQANGYESIELAGRGVGAVTALYSAPFIKDLKKLTLRNCLHSFSDLVHSDLHNWPHSILIQDLLNLCDLPDIIDHLEKNGCTVEVHDPWGAGMGERGIAKQ